MFERSDHQKTPRTVDEAARLILSDLLSQHLQTLSDMTDHDFDMLCEQVTPYLIDEFKLWQGNNTLLNSCLAAASLNENEIDPARIILNRLRKMIRNFNGFIIIT